MKSLAVSALFALFSANALATVTQQCVTPSTTGVTSDCTDLGAYGAIGNAYLLDGIGSCTFTFTQPVSANSLTISLDSVEATSQISVEVNGSSYTSAAGDISILTGSFSGGNLVISGSGYGATAGNYSGGSGTIALTNSPPPSITSLKVTSANASSAHALGVCFTAAPSSQPPGAPSIGVTTAGDSQASVAFTPPSSDGGAPISVYSATCTSSDGGVTGSGSGTSSPISVTGLTNGKTYTCTVKATNSVGDSTASSASATFAPSAPPPTPTPAAIPTLSEWAMIFMASLMAMFGIRRMRRSK